MSKRIAYTDAEHRAIAAAYVRLAVAQYEGRKVNKAALVRGIRAIFPHRTRGAIEAKFMNLSAAAVAGNLLEALPGGYVKGYKPAPNGAKSLGDFLRVAIHNDKAAHAIAAGFGAEAVEGYEVIEHGADSVEAVTL